MNYHGNIDSDQVSELTAEMLFYREKLKHIKHHVEFLLDYHERIFGLKSDIDTNYIQAMIRVCQDLIDAIDAFFTAPKSKGVSQKEAKEMFEKIWPHVSEEHKKTYP